jgi:hypothetical protein
MGKLQIRVQRDMNVGERFMETGSKAASRK